MGDAIALTAVLAFIAFCMHRCDDAEAAPPPAPCTCPDIDARVSAELAAQSGAVLESIAASQQQWDEMRDRCVWLPPASNVGVRPVRRVR